MTYGFDVFVHEVIAAIAISPVVIVAVEPSLNWISAVLSNSFYQIHDLGYPQVQ